MRTHSCISSSNYPSHTKQAPPMQPSSPSTTIKPNRGGRPEKHVLADITDPVEHQRIVAYREMNRQSYERHKARRGRERVLQRLREGKYVRGQTLNQHGITEAERVACAATYEASLPVHSDAERTARWVMHGNYASVLRPAGMEALVPTVDTRVYRYVSPATLRQLPTNECIRLDRHVREMYPALTQLSYAVHPTCNGETQGVCVVAGDTTDTSTTTHVTLRYYRVVGEITARGKLNVEYTDSEGVRRVVDVSRAVGRTALAAQIV